MTITLSPSFPLLNITSSLPPPPNIIPILFFCHFIPALCCYWYLVVLLLSTTYDLSITHNLHCSPLWGAVEFIRVFARMSPQGKASVIRALQKGTPKVPTLPPPLQYILTLPPSLSPSLPLSPHPSFLPPSLPPSLRPPPSLTHPITPPNYHLPIFRSLMVLKTMLFKETLPPTAKAHLHQLSTWTWQ